MNAKKILNNCRQSIFCIVHNDFFNYLIRGKVVKSNGRRNLVAHHICLFHQNASPMVVNSKNRNTRIFALLDQTRGFTFSAFHSKNLHLVLLLSHVIFQRLRDGLTICFCTDLCTDCFHRRTKTSRKYTICIHRAQIIQNFIVRHHFGQINRIKVNLTLQTSSIMSIKQVTRHCIIILLHLSDFLLNHAKCFIIGQFTMPIFNFLRAQTRQEIRIIILIFHAPVLQCFFHFHFNLRNNQNNLPFLQGDIKIYAFIPHNFSGFVKIFNLRRSLIMLFKPVINKILRREVHQSSIGNESCPVSICFCFIAYKPHRN
nr:MAG TPA: hypothetical protein [Caudoviricetes sp.]